MIRCMGVNDALTRMQRVYNSPDTLVETVAYCAVVNGLICHQQRYLAVMPQLLLLPPEVML